VHYPRSFDPILLVTFFSVWHCLSLKFNDTRALCGAVTAAWQDYPTLTEGRAASGSVSKCHIFPGRAAATAQPLLLLCLGVLCSAVLPPPANVECDLGHFVAFSFLSAKNKNNMLEDGLSSVLKRDNGLMYS